MRVGKVFLQTGVLQGVRLVSGICRAKLIAVFLGPAGVGIFAQAQNLQSMILAVGSLSLATGYVQRIRYLNDKYTEEYRREVHGTVFFTVLGALFLILLGLTPFLSWVEAKTFSGHVEPGFTGFVLWSVPLLGLAQAYFEPRLIAGERYADYVKAACVASILSVPALWILMKLADGWALSLHLFVMSVFWALFLGAFAYRMHGRDALLPLGWRWSHLRPILKVSIALVSTGLAFYGSAVWLRSLVLQQMGADYNGFIQVPIVFSGYYTPLLSHVIWNVYHVRLSESVEGQRANRILAASLTFVMLLQPLITIWIMTFPGLAVGLIYTGDFRHGINSFPWQFIGDFFYFLLTVLSVKVLATNRIKLYTALWIVFAVVELGAGALYILELKFALRSLALAYLTASAGTFVLFFWPAFSKSWRAAKDEFRHTQGAFLFGLGFLCLQAQLLRADADLPYRLGVAIAYSGVLAVLAWNKLGHNWASRWRDLIAGEV